MNVTIQEFVTAMIRTPAFAVTVLLILGVILVNGWTDAPNAIATTVASGTLGIRPAIFLASVCNFFGLWISARFRPAVAASLYQLAEFEDGSGRGALALCAAFVAILIWAVFAWWWGIPTSESHALIAGLSGASVALKSNVAGIRQSEWLRILAGLFGSLGFGLLAAFAFFYLLQWLLRKKKEDGKRILKSFQLLCCVAIAFLHGAQDGQKFLGILLLGMHLHAATSCSYIEGSVLPVWMLLLCAGTMAAGTAFGGRRIIKKIGSELVSLNRTQALASDLAGIVSLAIATNAGLPVSTTHVKTAAILGAGIANAQKVNRRLASEILLTWILTFPACMILGFVMTKLFLIGSCC